MGEERVVYLVLVTTIIFTLALVFIVIYIMNYNQRKRKHEEEKIRMKKDFDVEIARTELEVIEHTLQTIGSDLHDNVGQLLSLISFTLNSISLEDIEKTREKVDSAISLTKKSIHEMRLLGKLLNGEQLLSQGLVPAIKQEIQWLERSEQYHITCSITGILLTARDPDRDLIVFRMLQEIINNIIKHAQATLIELSIKSKNGLITINVNDNGVGFDTNIKEAAQGGMGLRSIRKRAALVNGHLFIDSSPNIGTRVRIEIPYV